MIDCPSAELMDDHSCILWLERSLHPQGFVCPRCGHAERRLFRAQEHCPADRGRACEGDSTLLTGTALATTRQRPATLVRVRRGIANGEPTARLARERGLSRKPLPTLRQRIHAHLKATAPTGVMTGTAFEADELSPNAGETKHAASRPL
jgi:hypothetical protein